MTKNLIHITEEEIIRLHDDLIEASGGLRGILNAGSVTYIVENAQFRLPQNLVDISAFLLCRIAKGHQFVDGNKRTAYFASRYFLMRNGADFNGSDTNQATKEVEAIAAEHNMPNACNLASKLVERYFVENQPIIPSYETFYRLVIKSIGVAQRLSEK